MKFFDVELHNNMKLEYVVFKVLAENGCFGEIDDIAKKNVLVEEEKEMRKNDKK